MGGVDLSSGFYSTLMGHFILLQVGNTTLIVFVSYFGSRVHRPRLIGCGAILVALAGLLMSLPHFISEPYRYDRTSPGKDRWGWAGGGHDEQHHSAPVPTPRPSFWPRFPGPSPPPLPPSSQLGPGEWGRVQSWGKALWADLGEGLFACHCFF